jgi:hypothetical protein
MEEAVASALGPTPEFDVSVEFEKYVALMRVLEKAAALYAPYLISGKFDQTLTGSQDFDALLDAERELSEDSLDIYTQVFMILLEYPEKIYDTITTSGMHWEENALPDVLKFCITSCEEFAVP